MEVLIESMVKTLVEFEDQSWCGMRQRQRRWIVVVMIGVVVEMAVVVAAIESGSCDGSKGSDSDRGDGGGW